MHFGHGAIIFSYLKKIKVLFSYITFIPAYLEIHMQNILCIILALTETKAKEKSDNRTFQVSPGIVCSRLRVFQ